MMYLMRTKKNNGADHERCFVSESEDATESRLVLLALGDALPRLRYACSVTVYTESTYIASALKNHWLEAWERNGWKNARDTEVQDSILWSRIYQLLEETGHELAAEPGSHEYAHWMRWKMQIVDAYQDIFSEVKESRPALYVTE